MNSPLNITILAKKGGVGKSNVSILLYEAFRQAGKTVAINDWDAQGTSTKALALIDPQDRDGKRPSPDIVIWDTPPSLDHTATATAVRHAHVALVISSPYPADTWEAEEAVEFVRNRNPKATVRVVINKFRKATLLGRLVDETVKESKATALPVMLGFRECYAHAVGQGWKALDRAAREEFLQFVVALLSLK
jgi:MinD-like ATPase involved in chromosome partitioning or flagellar assembly